MKQGWESGANQIQHLSENADPTANSADTGRGAVLLFNVQEHQRHTGGAH